MKFPIYFCLVALFLSLVSCGSYKQNIMFKPGENVVPEPIKKEALAVERNYIIQKNDYLKLDVFSNNGERIVDPNPDLSKSGSGQTSTARKEFNYLVDLDGIVKFPMVGELHVEGLTLRQAEEIVQKEYEKFFKESFVVLTYANKRVIVLGAAGGQVIPLINQNIHLAEVLALAKGIDNNAKANNIRVLRRDTYFLIDFTTIEGFRNGNLLIEPGDIVYIEPLRRPFAEGLRDYVGLFSLLVSLTSLVVILKATHF